MEFGFSSEDESTGGSTMIYLLHIILGWVLTYPRSAAFVDGIILTLGAVVLFIRYLAKFKGLRWEWDKDVKAAGRAGP